MSSGCAGVRVSAVLAMDAAVPCRASPAQRGTGTTHNGRHGGRMVGFASDEEVVRIPLCAESSLSRMRCDCGLAFG